MIKILRPSMQILLLVFVTLAVYYPSLFASVNSVDDANMLHYLLNSGTFTLQSIFTPGVSGSYYRPLLFSSFLLDKYFWGLEESFMHLENILLHLANTLLIFAVARRMVSLSQQACSVVPFLAALFFAIHPLNTEAVNWISGRTDLLAGFFLLLAMLAMLQRPGAFVWSMVAAICMLAGCLAKETAIFFLPAALLFPFYLCATRVGFRRFQQVLRSHVSHFAVFLFAGGAYFFFRAVAFSAGDRGVAQVATHVAGSESAGLWINLQLVLKAVGFYSKKLLIPFPLNFGIIHVSQWYPLLGIVVLAGIVFIFTRRTLPAFFVLCAGAIGCSALMIPLLRMTWTPVAERYMYIPSAFFLIGFTMAVQQWTKRFRDGNLLPVMVALIAGAAIYGTAARNVIWQDNLSLFQDTFNKSPDFLPARNELASAMHASGRTEEAAAIYKSFSSANGLVNFQYGLANKAFAFKNEGRYEEARAVLRQALAKPGKHEVMLLTQLLEVDKSAVMTGGVKARDVYAGSVQALSRLVEITGDPFYSYRQGILHMQVGERQKALAAFQTAVAKAPIDAYYRAPALKLAEKMKANQREGL